MFKKRILITTEIIITILLSAVLLLKLKNITENKNSYARYNDFWQNEENYDVLFFGCSHMMHTALPHELWRDYGIKSYNCANGAESIPTTYWVIKNAVEKHKPKVIFVELFFINSPLKVTKDQESLPHEFFDMVPLSNAKKEAIFDLYESESDRWSYLFDYSLYHSRWNQLAKADFYPSSMHLLGAKPYLKAYELVYKDDKQELSDIHQVGSWYLYRIKELCDENDIHLICVVNPYGAWNEDFSGNSNYKATSKGYGIEFLDLRDAGIVNIDTDCADRAHLNISGARKITDFYGKFLTENNYVQVCDKDDPVWEDYYKDYYLYKQKLMLDCEVADSLLTNLNDRDFFFDVVVRDYAELPNIIIKEIESAGDYNNVNLITDPKQLNMISVSVYDANKEQVLLEKQF